MNLITKLLKIISFGLFLLLFCSSNIVRAQSKKNKKKSLKEVIAPKDKDDIKSIEEATKKCRKLEGLFTLYQDTTSGSVYLLVKKDQVDKEFIYFGHTANGVVAAGHFRGSYRDNKIFTIRKYFNKIEFITENTSFYFDDKSAISKAADANISKSVMVSQAIIGQNKELTEFLIKADDIFLSESLDQVKASPNPNAKPGTSFSLGTLSKDKNKYVQIKSYPLNTDVVVEYVYENPAPVVRGGTEVTDDRFVSIKVQHSLIELPKNNYRSRYDDPRVGYFGQQITDMTSPSVTPFKDVINRWNLEKKDKTAALSEPVEPITWWLENTTPVEYRETIMAAALTWNEAFEMAGFKNAIAVKIQPDDANWDAGDIRYNVLRWTSSPRPPFGGYGPSFVNPRTGEIIGADVMLEYVFLTNRLNQEKLFDAAGLFLEDEPTNPEQHYCSLGHHLHLSSMFGLSALTMNNATEKEKDEYIKSSLYYLVLHELGHTLGLNHNMKSSQLYSPDEINNRELTSKTGLTGSVMDYPTVNLTTDKTKQGQYFTTKPGPYDKWAIEFGYSQALENETEEQKRLQKLLERSTEPALMFGNDADDMRSPGKAIDPRVMIGDMSSDAIGYSINRIKLVENLMQKIKVKYSITGKSYHELRNSYLILTSELSTAAGVMSRYIGGVYVDRGFNGQANAGTPFKAVSYKDQKRAMEGLSKYVFAPGAFSSPADLYSYLQMQRRGFGFFAQGEDPKIHDRVLNIQKNVLSHILHADVLKRITDSELYGNEYKLSEFMNDLTNAIFKEDLNTAVSTFRQNLQIEYANDLIRILSPDNSNKYDHRSKSMALYQLKTIEKMLQSSPGIDTETKAHRQHILFNIKKALEVK